MLMKNLKTSQSVSLLNKKVLMELIQFLRKIRKKLILLTLEIKKKEKQIKILEIKLRKDKRTYLNKTVKKEVEVSMKILKNLSLVKRRFYHLQARISQARNLLNKREAKEPNLFLKMIKKVLSPLI